VLFQIHESLIPTSSDYLNRKHFEKKNLFKYFTQGTQSEKFIRVFFSYSRFQLFKEKMLKNDYCEV